MCITDSHDMTLAVKVALNPNTTNQLNVAIQSSKFILMPSPIENYSKGDNSVKHKDELREQDRYKMMFNPLPDDKILDWSKLKQIAGGILKCF